MKNSQIYKLVEKSIDNLCQKLRKELYFFMSEDDIKCYLYHLLIQNKTLSKLINKDGIKTNLLHSEFAYHRGRPDISIINLEAIKPVYIGKLKPKYRLDSFAYRKGCEDFISIEIKFSWETPTPARTRDFNKKIRKDFTKLNKSKIGRGYLIIFDVNGVIEDKLVVKDNSKIKIKYIGPKQINL